VVPAARDMPGRYDIREEDNGWTVFDVWTGEPVVIALVPQVGLDIQDADELAELLDNLADRGNRSIFQ
jgi:hypothetical protein